MKHKVYWQTAIVAVSLASILAAGQSQTVYRSGSASSVYKPYTTTSSGYYHLLQDGKSAPLVTTWGYTTDDKRVDLDLNRASLKEALRKLFDQSKHDFSIEGDAPDTTITVHAKNVRFSTALDLITQAAGVHWRMENKDGKTSYIVGKSVNPGVYTWHSGTALKNGNSYVFSDKPFEFKNEPLTSIPYMKELFKPGQNNALTVPQLYTTLSSEQRSTFTCPHCKGQTTIIRAQQLQPKCPKCGRTFHSDWQFCPFDSSKRPATAGGWKYCPLCGKEVNVDEPEHRRGSIELIPAERVASSGVVTKVIPMTHANANAVIRSLPKQPGDAKVLSVDGRTNSVVVVGPSADVERFEGTVRVLDK